MLRAFVVILMLVTLSGCIAPPAPPAAPAPPVSVDQPWESVANEASVSADAGSARQGKTGSVTDGSGPGQHHQGLWVVPGGRPDGCFGNVIVVPPLEAGEGIWYDMVEVDPRTWRAPFMARITHTGDNLYPPLIESSGVTFLDAEGRTTGGAMTGAPSNPPGVAGGFVPAETTIGIFWICEGVGPMNVVYHAGWGA